MIEFRDVSFAYDVHRPLLQNVAFTVQDKDFVSFVGTNGAGKSTVMRLINRLLLPDSGEVLVDGVSTRDLKTSAIARKVGFLFQNPDSQICCNTVREELGFGFKAQGIRDAAADEKVDAAIEEFGFDGNADPFLLNRGTRQLLALASVVVLEPAVLVLDEPTTGLDYKECTKVMDAVSALHRQGTCVIMVCHDMEVVADYAQQVIVMHEGRVLAQGKTFEILRDRALMQQASIEPPQIVDISLRLQERFGLDRKSPLSQADTADEMFVAISDTLANRAEGVEGGADGAEANRAEDGTGGTDEPDGLDGTGGTDEPDIRHESEVACG